MMTWVSLTSSPRKENKRYCYGVISKSACKRKTPDYKSGVLFILAFAISKYSLSSSIPMKLRLRFLQATPVVPLKIIFIDSFYPLIKVVFSHSVLGKVAILTTSDAVFFCVSNIAVYSVDTITFQDVV